MRENISREHEKKGGEGTLRKGEKIRDDARERHGAEERGREAKPVARGGPVGRTIKRKQKEGSAETRVLRSFGAPGCLGWLSGRLLISLRS